MHNSEVVLDPCLWGSSFSLSTRHAWLICRLQMTSVFNEPLSLTPFLTVAFGIAAICGSHVISRGATVSPGLFPHPH